MPSSKELIRREELLPETFKGSDLFEMDVNSKPYFMIKTVVNLRDHGFNEVEVRNICGLIQQLFQKFDDHHYEERMTTRDCLSAEALSAIKRNFPGGIAAFLQYGLKLADLIEMGSFEQVVLPCLIENYSNEQPIPINTPVYLEMGIEVARQLGADGYPYFDVTGLSKSLRRLMNENPDAFASKIREGIETEQRIWEALKPLRQGKVDWQYAFETFLEYGDDPNWPDYIRGMERIIQAAVELSKEVDVKDDLQYVLEKMPQKFVIDPHSQWGLRGLEKCSPELIDSFIRSVLQSGKDYLYHGVEYFFELHDLRFSPREIETVLDHVRATKAEHPWDLELLNHVFPADSASRAAQRMFRLKEQIDLILNEKSDDSQKTEKLNRLFGGLSPDATALSRNYIDRLKNAAFERALPVRTLMRATDAKAIVPQNATTRNLIVSMATLAALRKSGGLLTNGEPVDFERLAEISGSPAFQSMAGEIRERMIPELDQSIRQARLRVAGLMPVGVKIHLHKAVSPDFFDFVKKTLGLDSTFFHLIHAGKTLVLPPLPSPQEQAMLIYVLDSLGLIDRDEPEIQTAMAGQWSQETAGWVGSAMLLATERGVRFRPGAFQSSHNQTGARMMAYDGGVKIEGLPFDLAAAKGRTDKLGGATHSDIGLYQFLGTLAAHLEHRGRFEREAEFFRRRFQTLLHEHGLLEAVHSTQWVFDSKTIGDTLEHHEKVIGTLTDRWFQDRDSGAKKGHGVIGQVRRLIRSTAYRIRRKVPRLIERNPEEIKALITY